MTHGVVREGFAENSQGHPGEGVEARFVAILGDTVRNQRIRKGGRGGAGRGVTWHGLHTSQINRGHLVKGSSRD